MMQITIELPEDIAVGLEAKWEGSASCSARKPNTGSTSVTCPHLGQLRRLLVFETQTQVDAFLKEHKIFDYSARGFRTGS
jgi:hypothetical protein